MNRFRIRDLLLETKGLALRVENTALLEKINNLSSIPFSWSFAVVPLVRLGNISWDRPGWRAGQDEPQRAANGLGTDSCGYRHAG